jgi:hypothetical protein
MSYYLSLPFIWLARIFYNIHVRLDSYTSWILDEEENLFTYEEIGARMDKEILNQMEEQL